MLRGNASTAATDAPVGALRLGLLLVALAILAAVAPVDWIPAWLSMTLFVVGGLLLAVALGIRMLRR